MNLRVSARGVTLLDQFKGEQERETFGRADKCYLTVKPTAIWDAAVEAVSASFVRGDQPLRTHTQSGYKSR